MGKFVALAAASLLFVSAHAGAGAQGVTIAGPSARDVAPATGRATIRGRVIAADTGRPLRDARVSVSAPELLTTRVVATDAQGRYELAQLPAGEYTISASKETFATIALGQTRPSGAVQTVTLGETQIIENANFSLPRGGVIAGAVFDEAGDPLIAATVTAWRATYPRGQRQLVSVATAMTNDLGEYRIFGLPPGSFYVSAAKRWVLGVNFVPSSESTYPATLFPGTAHFASARPVTLKLGQTVGNISMTLMPVRTATISGAVMPIPARNAAVTVRQLGTDLPVSTTTISGVNLATSPTSDRLGDFAVSWLPPGEYELRATVASSGPDANASFAQQKVTVGGTNVDGIQLVMVNTPAGSGRVVLDPAAAAALRPELIKIGTEPADPAEAAWLTATVVPAADFSFSLRAQPGRMLVRPVLPKGWALKAVRAGGVDVTDDGIEFKAGEEVRDIEIELTNHPSETSGTAHGGRGERVLDYTVVVFARDRENEIASPRYFAVASSDRDGRFSVSGLAPGRYFAAAVAGIEADEAGNPDLIERLRPDAVSFSVPDGGANALDLKVVQ